MMEESKTCVVGLGYVGLPTAVTLASKGLQVVGFDIDARAVDLVNKGEAPIIEADLDELLREVVYSGHLIASTVPESCQAYLIAVPTPVEEGNLPDLKAVFSAVLSISAVLEAGALVVLESTSPIGTTDEICEMMAQLRPDLKFPHEHPESSDVQVAFCPERILPGRTLHELIYNDRVVGGVDRQSAERARDIYRLFCEGEISLTTARAAELVKCTENAFRDVNIAFANELSMICAKLDLNVNEVIQMANHHPRVDILQPGCGVGGHCIPIDPWFIVHAAPEEANLIRTAREVNLAKADFVARDIARVVKENGAKKLAVLGLAYKPDVDDLRESPSVQIAKYLMEEEDISCLLVEPNVDVLPVVLADQKNGEFVDLEAALDAADAVVVLVSHGLFQGIDQEHLGSRVFIDYTGRR